MLFQKHSVTALLTALCLFCAAHLQANTYQFVGTYSNWTDATAWSPEGIPGSTDTVILDIAESATLLLNTDVTVHTLIIERISQIAGNGPDYSTLTVQNRLLCKFIPSFGCNLVIGAGATAEFNNDNFSSPFAGIYCYGDVTVDGALTSSVELLSAPRITINGTFTHLNGGLGGEIKVNPGATLTLNSPNKLIQLGFVNNAGTFNWQAGDIYSSSSLINSGLWNISSNDSIYTGDFTQGSNINNTGQIRIAAAVERVSVQWRLDNQGSVVLEGASTFHALALRNRGSITGPAGSTLELSGYYFDTGNVLEANSTVNVGTLRTNYLTALDIKPGAIVDQTPNFEFGAGPLNLGIALPPAANYVLNCQAELAVDQVFMGNVSVGGTFSGPQKVTFNTTNATLNNATFYNALAEISSGSVVTLNTGGFFGNVVNNGVINWVSNGLLVLNQPGLTNNASFNISAPNTQVYSQGFGNPGVDLLNNGTIALDAPGVGGTMQTYLNGFLNNGTVTVGSNDTLRLGGMVEQNSQLTGATGSCLELTSGTTRFAPAAVTAGFSALSTVYSEVLLTEGTILNNIGGYRFTGSTVDVDVVLAPAPAYVFDGSMVRLSTTFQPAAPLVVRNTTFEGSGSVRIPNLLDWEGGTFDVPLRIEENATATIRESSTQRPIISSPFTNRGTVTLSGGIIEINTGFFSNKGTWQVNSTEDVIIDGFTPYTNDGTFAICGNQPIQIIFNVPFVNQANGTFKGEGTYTFNAEYTNNGTAAPGCSPGVLEIDSDFQTGAGLDVEIEGTDAGQYDLFRIRGDLEVSGHLWVFVPTGAAPAGPVTIVETDGNISGTFDSTDLPEGYTLTYNAQSIVVNTTGAVSTQDLTTAQGWRIHPTLVTDRLRWQADQPAQGDRWLRIWNTQGQLVQTSLVPSNTSLLEVLVSDLTPGVYTVTNDDGARSRFVKM